MKPGVIIGVMIGVLLLGLNPPTFANAQLLAEYSPHIIADVLFILAQMVLIGLLIASRRRLKKAQNELRQQSADLEFMVAARTAELRQSQQLLESAKAVANLGIWELDLVHNCLSWSDEMYVIFGLDKETFAPSREAFLELLPADDRAEMIAAYQHSLATQSKFQLVHRVKLGNGRVKWIESQCETRFDEQGTPLYSIGTAYDISRQKDTEEKFKTYLELASDGIHILDEKGNVFECSHSFAETMGYSYEEALTLNVRDWDKDVSLTAEARLRRLIE